MTPWDALAEEPAKADGRWLGGLGDVERDGSLVLVQAMARDPDDATATRAFGRLFTMLHQGLGLAVRGAACAFLGELRDPRATPELVEEMTRPSVGGSMSLWCIPALERCGDATALPTLRARLSDEPTRRAIAAIEARRGRLDFGEVRLARAHPDHAIAALALRAQLGDEDAYLVLEDALREGADRR